MVTRNALSGVICGVVVLGVVVTAAPVAHGSPWTDTVTALGPQAWWRLNEPSGPTAYDTANSYDGTYTGSPAYGQAPAFDAAETPANRAVGFSGNDYVTMGDVLDQGTGSFTLVAVFRKTTTSTGAHKIVNKGQTVSGTPPKAGYAMRMRDGLLEFTAYADVGRQAVVSEPAVDEWHLAVGVLDRAADEMQLYVDPETAVPDDTQSATGLGSVDTNIPLAIGALDRGIYGVKSEHWIGDIDEVLIFNTALTGEQVCALGAASGLPEPASLVLLAGGGLALLPRARRRR